MVSRTRWLPDRLRWPVGAALLPDAPVCVAVGAACVGLWAVVAALDVLGAVAREESLAALGASYAGVVHDLQVHRLLTAPLLHVRVTHLVFNMLSLWMLGPDVERRLGSRRFAVLLAASGVGSIAGFLAIHPGAWTIVCGLSGAVFALLVAQARFFPERVVYVYAFFPLRMRDAALLLAAIELYLVLVPGQGGIANAAHLSGALVAWGLLLAFERSDVGSARSPAATASAMARGRVSRSVPWEL